MGKSVSEYRGRSLVNNFTNLNRVAAEGVSVMVSGRGVFVRDDQGREYLDAISGLWSASFGFDDPDLVAAAAEQFGRLPTYHIAADKATEPVLRLAERLCRIGPGQVTRVLFTNSGSEANDTQIKLLNYLWNWRGETSRRRFIARRGAFHGSTLGAGSLSDSGESSAAFGLPVIDVPRLTAPSRFRHGYPGETEEEFVRRLAVEFEDLVVECGPETIAGVFLEPVMGAGGVIVPPAGYYDAMQQVAERFGVRIVADEVICGFGRLGALWGCDVFGLTPDSTSCAKGLSAGYLPIGAVLVDTALEEAMLGQSAKLGTFAHGFTGGGHPVAAAVALRTLELLEERNLIGHAARVGELLQNELSRLAEFPVVADVRGVGLLAGVELRGPHAADLVQQTVRHAAGLGLLVRGIGSAICLCPPLIMKEDEVATLVLRLGAALERLGGSDETK